MVHPRNVASLMILIIVPLWTLIATAEVSAAQTSPASFESYSTGIMQLIAGVGTFTGTLTTNGFTLANGVITGTGTVAGKLTDTAGNVTAIISTQPVTVLVASFASTCTTLTVHTGPVTVVSQSGSTLSLSPIDVVITAPTVPDNQLGNLLCSMINLLNSNAPLADVVTRLNEILGAIRA